MPIERKKIVQPHLILCEGRDAEGFLMWLVNVAKSENSIFNKIQIFDFEGIENLRNSLQSLQSMSGYNIVQSLSIIRDAETNWQGAVQSVQSTLKSCGYAVPPNPAVPARAANAITTGFVLFPTCDAMPTNGTLEDLCLSTLAKETDEVMECVDFAMELIPPLTRPHKNRLHAYFSYTDDFVGLKIGEASKANAFNARSLPVVALKSFLLQMTQ